MKKAFAGITAIFIFLITEAQFNYGYISHTAQLTSVDKGLLSVSDRALMPVDFKYIYSNIKGSAFFSPDWLYAIGYSQKNVRYTGFKAQFDLYKNSFYLNLNDTIYNASPVLTRFELFPAPSDSTKKFIFSNQFSVPEVPAGKYVQVLNEGKLTFLKYTTKDIQEVQTGVYTDKEQTFNEKVFYYGLSPAGQSISITKLNKKNMQKILGDKWAAVEKFVDADSNLSYLKEEDWQKIIQYYNSIQ
ncbi:MAG: hypothetical protein ABUT20_24820 [Bacteroidota bacterium]